VRRGAEEDDGWEGRNGGMRKNGGVSSVSRWLILGEVALCFAALLDLRR